MQLRKLNKTLEAIEQQIKENTAQIMKEKEQELLSRLFTKKNKIRNKKHAEISLVDDTST